MGEHAAAVLSVAAAVPDVSARERVSDPWRRCRDVRDLAQLPGESDQGQPLEIPRHSHRRNCPGSELCPFELAIGGDLDSSVIGERP
jgi:hypothetical protein